MMLEKRLIEAQSTLKKRIRELIIPLLIFILTAFGFLIYGIGQSAKTQDRLVVENSEKLLAALIAERKEQMQSLAKTNFLANMSPELRTPLNAIIGFSDLIKQQIFGPEGAAADNS